MTSFTATCEPFKGSQGSRKHTARKSAATLPVQISYMEILEDTYAADSSAMPTLVCEVDNVNTQSNQASVLIESAPVLVKQSNLLYKDAPMTILSEEGTIKTPETQEPIKNLLPVSNIYENRELVQKCDQHEKPDNREKSEKEKEHAGDETKHSLETRKSLKRPESNKMHLSDETDMENMETEMPISHLKSKVPTETNIIPQINELIEESQTKTEKDVIGVRKMVEMPIGNGQVQFHEKTETSIEINTKQIPTSMHISKGRLKELDRIEKPHVTKESQGNLVSVSKVSGNPGHTDVETQGVVNKDCHLPNSGIAEVSVFSSQAEVSLQISAIAPRAPLDDICRHSTPIHPIVDTQASLFKAKMSKKDGNKENKTKDNMTKNKPPAKVDATKTKTRVETGKTRQAKSDSKSKHTRVQSAPNKPVTTLTLLRKDKPSSNSQETHRSAVTGYRRQSLAAVTRPRQAPPHSPTSGAQNRVSGKLAPTNNESRSYAKKRVRRGLGKRRVSMGAPATLTKQERVMGECKTQRRFTIGPTEVDKSKLPTTDVAVGFGLKNGSEKEQSHISTGFSDMHTFKQNEATKEVTSEIQDSFSAKNGEESLPPTVKQRRYEVDVPKAPIIQSAPPAHSKWTWWRSEEQCNAPSMEFLPGRDNNAHVVPLPLDLTCPKTASSGNEKPSNTPWMDCREIEADYTEASVKQQRALQSLLNSYVRQQEEVCLLREELNVLRSTRDRSDALLQDLDTALTAKLAQKTEASK